MPIVAIYSALAAAACITLLSRHFDSSFSDQITARLPMPRLNFAARLDCAAVNLRMLY